MVEILQLRLGGGLALERGSREVFAAGGERLPCLRVELDEALLELVGLQLEPFFGRHDVGYAALDVLEQLELRSYE